MLQNLTLSPSIDEEHEMPPSQNACNNGFTSWIHSQWGRPYLSEHVCGDHVHFIQQKEAPLPTRDGIHDLLGLFWPSPCVCNHGVGRNHHTCIPLKHLLLWGRKPARQVAVSWGCSPAPMAVTFPKGQYRKLAMSVQGIDLLTFKSCQKQPDQSTSHMNLMLIQVLFCRCNPPLQAIAKIQMLPPLQCTGQQRWCFKSPPRFHLETLWFWRLVQ